MDWIRQNTFLASFGGIMLLGVLGLGFFTFSSLRGASAARETFETTRTDLARLEGSKLHPDSENLQKVKLQVDAYEKSVNDLYSKLEAAQQPLPTSTDVTKFGEKVVEKRDLFLEKAKDTVPDGKQEPGIVVGDSFYMGMDRYRTQNLRNDTDLLQKLEWQLGGIEELVNLALQAKVQSIDQFRRYSEPWEDGKVAEPAATTPKRGGRPTRGAKPAAAKAVEMADVMESARVRIRLTGTPDAVNEFFNLVSNNKKYHFWTRWAKVANETPSGPLRLQDYTPIPVGDDPDAGVGGEPQRNEAPENPGEVGGDAFQPPMIDVFPILGGERVRAEMVIFIVRFREPAEPKPKPKSRSN